MRSAGQGAAALAPGPPRLTLRTTDSRDPSHGALRLTDSREHCLHIGQHQRVVADPCVANNAGAIEDEHGAFTQPIKPLAVAVFRRVHHSVLADHLAIQITEQREWQVKRGGKGAVCPVALHTEAKERSSQVGEPLAVLTERRQLTASY